VRRTHSLPSEAVTAWTQLKFLSPLGGEEPDSVMCPHRSSVAGEVAPLV